ncbi:MAG: HEAT repeat domain-containing protein [Bdellovibrionales bacterium]|nr:HEAT repeat domain-containing protein [Bdellovibrionales bacterium]
MLRILLLIYMCAAFSGCFVFVPFIEKDEVPPYARMQEKSVCQVPPIAAAKAPARSSRQLSRTERQRRLISKYVYNLDNEDTVVRIHAASHLGDMGPAARSAVSPLIRSLSDSHYWVRRTAAKSLGKIGDPRAVEPLVDRMRRDSDRYVNLTAANALRRIGTPEALAAVRGQYN